MSLKLLNERQIKQKIKRLAFQILENNFGEKEIILAGINNNGMGFAKLIHKQLQKISDTNNTFSCLYKPFLLQKHSFLAKLNSSNTESL